VCINGRQKTPKKPRLAQPKECSKCGALKPAHEFFKEPRHADGLRADCKTCNVAGRAEQQLAWFRANPEKRKKYNATDSSKRRRAVFNKQWKAENPEKVAEYDARKRAKRRGVSIHDLTAGEWKAIKALYGNRCAYCGVQRQRLTKDHVVPLVLGGGHTFDNVVPACLPCNMHKHAGPAPTYQPVLVH
jgi:pyruvate/2-oxoglutarate dehydrogenase complex dihydrolipoamide acyltransferase (E2) component